MTTVADGLYQFGGMPVASNLITTKLFSTPTGTSEAKGRAWFVDPGYGGNGDGTSPKQAFSTMQAAFNALSNGDIIYFVGKVVEQLVTPVQVFDVTIIGCGNRPRHADATPAGGNWAASQWGPPASGGVAAQATVRVLQQGWRFANILFTAVDANAGCIELVRNAGASDAERDASHAEILGCRFSGTGIGVKLGATSFTENVFNALIDGNTFNNMSQGIFNTSCQANGIQIRNNTFFGNTKHITAKLQNGFITNNFIGPFTASGSSGGIDLTGGVAGNVVTLNYLSGTYSNAGGYVAAGAADEWAGNMNVISGGWTAADPA